MNVLCPSGMVYYANENVGPIRKQDTSCNNSMNSVCLVSVAPYLCQAVVPVSRNSVHVAFSVRQLVYTARIFYL